MDKIKVDVFCGLCNKIIETANMDKDFEHQAIIIKHNCQSLPNAPPEVEGANVCPTCKGYGCLDDEYSTMCMDCKGTGKHEVEGTEGGVGGQQTECNHDWRSPHDDELTCRKCGAIK